MRIIVVTAAAAVVAASCYTPMQNPPPPIELPAKFSAAAGKGQVGPGRWWEEFGDRQLSSLVDAAMSGNFQVKAAFARIEQAHAAARIAGAPLLPAVNATGDLSRARTPSPFGNQPGLPRSFTNTQKAVSLAASYEIDLWGRLRSGQKSAVLDVAARRDDLESVAISTAAEVAEAWFDVLQQRERRALLDRQLEVHETFLELVNLRAGQGLASALDVFQARQQVATTKAQQALIDGQLATARNRIAILVGDLPGAVKLAKANKLPKMPPAPAAGVPSTLLERRPDIRAARRRVESADWRVAQAVADRFPRLTLSGSIGYQSVGELADPVGLAWRMASNLVAPIFDFGLRAAQVDRNKAVVRELIHNYGQAVLQALVEVENALALENSQRANIVEVEKQVNINQLTLEQARNRYRQGLTDFLPVLNALQALQASEQGLLTARRQLLAFRIQLYRALGGTWTVELSDPDAPAKAEDE